MRVHHAHRRAGAASDVTSDVISDVISRPGAADVTGAAGAAAARQHRAQREGGALRKSRWIEPLGAQREGGALRKSRWIEPLGAQREGGALA